jgi:hypothetical protein
VGHWWLQEPNIVNLPLADRVEKEIVTILLSNPAISFEELEFKICFAFPGLFTPSREFLEVCLESYGEPDPPKSGNWKIREQDSPTKRRADIAEISNLIQSIGSNLGFTIEQIQADPPTFSWIDDGTQINTFFIHASAILSESIKERVIGSAQNWLVIPGGRANLVIFKMQNNPVMQSEVEEHWQFLKFRHIRRLAEDDNLNRANLPIQLSLDPLMYTDPQLRML